MEWKELKWRTELLGLWMLQKKLFWSDFLETLWIALLGSTVRVIGT